MGLGKRYQFAVCQRWGSMGDDLVVVYLRQIEMRSAKSDFQVWDGEYKHLRLLGVVLEKTV